MNVTLDKNGNVSGVLTISLVEEDYQAEVKKQLAELGRRRPIKGFRPGHVPAGLLKKYYGGQVTAEVVDQVVSRELTNYIRENNIDLLGEPMLSPDTKVDMVNEKDFSFKFDLGFAPEFELKLDKRVKVPYYNIEVSQEMIDNQNDAFKKRFGTQVAGEVADEDALLRGSMVELAEDGTAKEDGIKVERTIVSPKYLKDDDEKAKFVGKKVGDELVFNPGKGAGGNVTELAAMLNIDKDQAADVKSDFNFKVEEILVNKDAEMGQELFDSVLGKDVVKTEKEYFEKVKEMLAGQLKNDSNYRFTLDAEQVLKKKVGDLEMPDEFLKRYLVSINKDADQAKIEEEYPRTREEIVWQLIKEKVARTYDVKIEQDDLMRLARIYASQQFAQYGMGNLPDDMLDRYAGELLENKDYSREISRRAFEDKVFATIRDNVSLNEKTVTVEEFNKLFEKDKK
ncbi:MAG: trigger factor [Muribaculaceae bacterium]|nr:trigger factor [Muribaculaceae bacterium]